MNITPPIHRWFPGTPAVDRTDDRTAIPIRAQAAGSGCLPALASGRPRGACRGGARVTAVGASHDAPAPAPARGLPRVLRGGVPERRRVGARGIASGRGGRSSWPSGRRRSVWTELGAASELPVGEPESATGVSGLENRRVAEPAGQHAAWYPEVREHRLRRMAGVAMLAGAVGAVGGVVCLNLARTQRRAPGRGSLLAATRTAEVAGSRPRPTMLDPRWRRRGRWSCVLSKTRRARVSRHGPAQVARRTGSPPLRSSPPRHTLRHAATPALWSSPTMRIAVTPRVTAAPAPAAVPPAPAQPAPEAGGTTIPAVATAPAHPAPEGRAEFGFER